MYLIVVLTPTDVISLAQCSGTTECCTQCNSNRL